MYEFNDPQKNVKLKAFLWVAYSEALITCRRCEYYLANTIASEIELPFWRSNRKETLVAEAAADEALRDLQMISKMLQAVRLNVLRLEIPESDFSKMDAIVKKAQR